MDFFFVITKCESLDSQFVETSIRNIFNTEDVFCFHLQPNTTLTEEDTAPHTSGQEQITHNILKYKVTCMGSAP